MKPSKGWRNPFPGRWVYSNGEHCLVVSFRDICFDEHPWRIEILDSAKETVEQAMAVPTLAQTLKEHYKTLWRAQLASEMIVNSLA